MIDNLRILVVDDCQATDIAICLARVGYTQVETAFDSYQAFELASQYQGNLMLMDNELNDRLGGIEACRQIRATEHGKNTGIIGMSNRHVSREFTEAGADAFLDKDNIFYSKDILSATIEEVMAKYLEFPDIESPTILVYGEDWGTRIPVARRLIDLKPNAEVLQVIQPEQVYEHFRDSRIGLMVVCYDFFHQPALIDQVRKTNPETEICLIHSGGPINPQCENGMFRMSDDSALYSGGLELSLERTSI